MEPGTPLPARRVQNLARPFGKAVWWDLVMNLGVRLPYTYLSPRFMLREFAQILGG